jgi:hypothetical protein
MKAETRDGFEYEMTVVLDLIHDGHFATATKDRTGLFSDANPQPITVDTGAQLKAWLEAGAEPPKVERLTEAQVADIEALADECGVDVARIVKAAKVARLADIEQHRLQGVTDWILSKAQPTAQQLAEQA